MMASEVLENKKGELNIRKRTFIFNPPFLPCDPVGIQTQDLQNRNLTLYSAKLRDRLLLQSYLKIYSSAMVIALFSILICLLMCSCMFIICSGKCCRACVGCRLIPLDGICVSASLVIFQGVGECCGITSE